MRAETRPTGRQGIDFGDRKPERRVDEAEDSQREPNLLKAPATDLIHMYEREIGTVRLLRAEQEVDLSVRTEAG